MLPKADIQRQEGKYSTIKVLQGYVLKLLLHSVNSVPILYRTGNMQSAILLSLVASSSLPLCGLQSTHPQMPCYINIYVVYNIYGNHSDMARRTSSARCRMFYKNKKLHGCATCISEKFKLKRYDSVL